MWGNQGQVSVPGCTIGGFLEAVSSTCRLFEELHKLQTLGVALQGRQGQCCYELHYGGEVDRAGNCLFDAVAVALGGGAGSLLTGTQVRTLPIRTDGIPHSSAQKSAKQQPYPAASVH